MPYCARESAAESQQRLLAGAAGTRGEECFVMFEAYSRNCRAVSRGALAALLLSFGGGALAQDPPSPVEGTWRTLNGTEVAVRPCAQGYCGYLSWIVIPTENSAQCIADRVGFATAMMDYSNPDATLRTRSLIGMEMMTIRPTANPNVFDGTIYNVQDGKFYDGVIEIVNGSTMKLGNGCVFNVCVVSQEWPRVADREGPPDFLCTPG